MSLHEEIKQQPGILEKLLESQKKELSSVVDLIQEYSPNYVFIVARGTSDHAGLYGKYLLGSMNRLPIALAAPSLFTLYDTPPTLKNALVIAISQSGQSPDILSVVEKANYQKAMTISITNDPESPLAKNTAHNIDISAGEEKSVAATKTYTASLLSLALLSAQLRDDVRMMNILEKVPAAVQQALGLEELIAERVQRYRYMDHCVVLGRGFNYATAFEWALKLKELTYTVAEPYSTADFRHGPFAMLEPGFPVLSIATRGMTYRNHLELLQEARYKFKADVVCVSDDEESKYVSNVFLKIPGNLPEWATPMVAIVIGQLFSYHLTLAKDLDPDKPRSIRKVTKTV